MEEELRLKILKAVEDNGIDNTDRLADELALPPRRVVSIVKGLIEDRLLSGKDATTKDGPFIGLVETTSAGRRVLEQGLAPWPQVGGSISIGSLAGNVQVGTGNVMNVDARIGLQQLVQAIDQVEASEAEKQEAKTILKRLGEHPITSAFAGAAFTAMFEAMKRG